MSTQNKLRVGALVGVFGDLPRGVYHAGGHRVAHLVKRANVQNVLVVATLQPLAHHLDQRTLRARVRVPGSAREEQVHVFARRREHLPRGDGTRKGHGLGDRAEQGGVGENVEPHVGEIEGKKA